MSVKTTAKKGAAPKGGADHKPAAKSAGHKAVDHKPAEGTTPETGGDPVPPVGGAAPGAKGSDTVTGGAGMVGTEANANDLTGAVGEGGDAAGAPNGASVTTGTGAVSSGDGDGASDGPGDGGEHNEPAAEPAFPCNITVRNNSHIALVDPVSGMHAQAGGSATVTLHDADHAHRVLENLAALLEANYLPATVLSIEGLPQ